MQCPQEAHWDAALRVVRYLKGDSGQGIFLRSSCDLRLTAFCDSDWASCPMTRRSLTMYFVRLGVSPISWKTKKQHTVSRSSAEAEYRSMATTCCELNGFVVSFVIQECLHRLLLVCIAIVKLHCILRITLSSMSARSILRWIVISPATRFKPGLSLPLMFELLSNLRIFLLRHLDVNRLNIFSASWAFGASMLQLEGEY